MGIWAQVHFSPSKTNRHENSRRKRIQRTAVEHVNTFFNLNCVGILEPVIKCSWKTMIQLSPQVDGQSIAQIVCPHSVSAELWRQLLSFILAEEANNFGKSWEKHVHRSTYHRQKQTDTKTQGGKGFNNRRAGQSHFLSQLRTGARDQVQLEKHGNAE